MWEIEFWNEDMEDWDLVEETSEIERIVYWINTQKNVNSTPIKILWIENAEGF